MGEAVGLVPSWYLWCIFGASLIYQRQVQEMVTGIQAKEFDCMKTMPFPSSVKLKILSKIPQQTIASVHEFKVSKFSPSA